MIRKNKKIISIRTKTQQAFYLYKTAICAFFKEKNNKLFTLFFGEKSSVISGLYYKYITIVNDDVRLMLLIVVSRFTIVIDDTG